MAKNGNVHESWKEGRSNATPTRKKSVDFYDLKSFSFKFGNDIVITFEMPSVANKRPVGKIYISMLFRPSVIRGPCLDLPLPDHNDCVMLSNIGLH